MKRNKLETSKITFIWFPNSAMAADSVALLDVPYFNLKQ